MFQLDGLNRTALLMAVSTAVLVSGSCSKQGNPHPSAPNAAQASLVFSEAPAGVLCVAITIATDRADRRRFGVTPGTPAVFSVDGLRPGPTVFSADAYDVPCAQLGSNAVASWVGGPVSATLKLGPNGPIVIVLTRNSQSTVVLGFDPGPGGTCAFGGSACAGHGDCCSRFCQTDPSLPGGVGICRADEPPAPTDEVLQYHPEILTAIGAHATYPAFDGDSFFVAFPRGTCDSENPDRDAPAIRGSYIMPALSATGFTNFDSLATPPNDPVVIEGGNYADLVETACNRLPNFGRGDEMCELLRNPQRGTTDGGDIPFGPQQLATLLGRPAAALADEINRPLNYWIFTQRIRNIPIEHKAAVALQHGADRRVSAVFGSVISRFVETNKVELAGPRAVEEALKTLARVEGLNAAKPRAPEPVLVALPYGAAPRDAAGRGTGTAIRFAYRASVQAARIVGFGPITNVPAMGVAGALTEPAAYTVWADAATGALLKYVSESGDAQAFSPVYCRNPAEANNGQCGMTLELATVTPSSSDVDLGQQPRFSLKLPGMQYTPAPAGMALENIGALADTCDSQSHYRGLNAFAWLEQARRAMIDGGGYVDLPPVTVFIDEQIDQNKGNFGEKTLRFARGVTGDAMCPSTQSTRLSGAQDATIVTHEFAHLTTPQLQATTPPAACGAPPCPVANPYNRTFFHDYADGLAALHTESPCIGGWSAKNMPITATATGEDMDAVARACAASFETDGLPRMLYADDNPGDAFVSTAFPRTGPDDRSVKKDRFPEHRQLSAAGDYADGQIVGAALFHTWQGAYSHARVAGTLPIWGFVNRAVGESAFSPLVGAAFDRAIDLNVYRSGQELLTHLTDAWINGGATASLNKLHSAFARAGFFLTPMTCLLGQLGSTSAVADATYCPSSEGRNGADAIVDIDDQDSSDGDYVQRSGIRLADNDFVARASTGPKFRVWTGVPFAFSSPSAFPAGQALSKQPMCNDTFQVEVRAPGRDWQRVGPEVSVPTTGASVTTSTSATTGAATTACYGTVTFSDTEGEISWKGLTDANPGNFIKIEYRVKTWRGPDKKTERNSLRPGNGHWSTPDDLQASSFFITNAGVGPR